MRHAVILAGGGGSRLWPASRQKRPKQFLPLFGSASLLEDTCVRVQAVTDAQTIVTSKELAAQTLEHANGAKVIAEPNAQGTAAAAALAAADLAHNDPAAVLGFFPADHYIADPEGFQEIVIRAFKLCEEKQAIVLVGIDPAYPATGYGYLELGDTTGTHGQRVRRFVEKPDKSTAETMFTGQAHVWNSGMLFAPANVFLAAVAEHLPICSSVLAKYVELGAAEDAAAAAYLAENYSTSENTSIDYGILEHRSDLLAVRGSFGWNDVGAWPAVAEILAAKAADNGCLAKTVVEVDSAGNIVFANDDTAVGLLGVTDTLIVKWDNAVLVADKHRPQEVKKLVQQLEAMGLDDYR